MIDNIRFLSTCNNLLLKVVVNVFRELRYEEVDDVFHTGSPTTSQTHGLVDKSFACYTILKRNFAHSPMLPFTFKSGVTLSKEPPTPYPTTHPSVKTVQCMNREAQNRSEPQRLSWQDRLEDQGVEQEDSG